MKFKLVTEMRPRGDQPKAIEELTESLLGANKHQTLLGVTGSGKTFTLAHVINNINKATLVISHNKTLAAQLYSEFKEFFPHNAVEYFVSYYDYYQPEAYVPHTDTYIEKDASINDEIDKLRLAATSSLMMRDDVLIVASVSCIYGLGSPDEYKELMVILSVGDRILRDEILQKLVWIHYERSDADFTRGTFRVRGEVIEIFPAYEETALRVELSEDKVGRISEIHPITGKTLSDLEKVAIYPATHFVTTEDKIEQAIHSIKEELGLRLTQLRSQGKLVEAQRLESRTNYDMEMLREIGYCTGIENYSRHLSGREPHSRPYCLLDYFPKDNLTIIDESHVAIPQLRGMYEGDKARKEILVEYGFRLPSALDNRPLRFDEFEKLIKQVIYTSATPGPYEFEKSKKVAEQIIRPTGLVDPPIEVRPTKNQIDDLINEIKRYAEKKERTLVTTLTKRMAEDLAAYLKEMGIMVRYLHSEIDAIERVKILRELRLGKFDCLVGINLLREGLDLPEVSLVAVLDADKEGFLRSQTSIIQVGGRAARNIDGRVILYADIVTGSMKRAMLECERRRKIQLAYNEKHNITPRSVEKAIRAGLVAEQAAKQIPIDIIGQTQERHELMVLLSELEHEMELAARNLQFERAAFFRDQIEKLKEEYGVKEGLKEEEAGSKEGSRQKMVRGGLTKKIKRAGRRILKRYEKEKVN